MKAIVEAGTDSGPRVRLTDCPMCRRPMTLNHAGMVDDDGDQYVDMTTIALAQRLHLVQCDGR